MRELFEEGKSSDKKHRFQPQVIKQYVKTVNKLRNTLKLEDLFVINSLNYQKKIILTDLKL